MEEKTELTAEEVEAIRARTASMLERCKTIPFPLEETESEQPDGSRAPALRRYSQEWLLSLDRLLNWGANFLRRLGLPK